MKGGACVSWSQAFRFNSSWFLLPPYSHLPSQLLLLWDLFLEEVEKRELVITSHKLGHQLLFSKSPLELRRSLLTKCLIRSGMESPFCSGRAIHAQFSTPSYEHLFYPSFTCGDLFSAWNLPGFLRTLPRLWNWVITSHFLGRELGNHFSLFGSRIG